MNNSMLSIMRELKDGLLGKDIKEITLYEGQNTSSIGQNIPLKGNTSVLISVNDIVRGNLTPLASFDGENWKPVKAISTKTYNGFEYIHHPEEFLVDVTGYKYFRLPLNLPFNSGFATVKLYEVPRKRMIEKSVDKYKPVPLTPENYMTDNTARVRPTTIKDDDTWYGVSGAAFMKSSDKGDNWTSIYNVGDDRARNIKALDDGTLLLFTRDGKVLKSNIEETEFTETFSAVSPDIQWNEHNAVDVYKNFIFINEYGTKVSEDPCRRAYMSDDYGDTWTLIFEEEIRNDFHIHQISYDPYDNLLWILVGDGEDNANVIVSDDFGDNWHYVYQYGECPTQLMTVLSLPNCVLFTSDNRHDSIWRWDRKRTGIQSLQDIVIEPAFTINRENPGAENLGTIGFVDYEGDGAAYFGFVQHSTNLIKRDVVWATKNGYDFYPIWTSPYHPYSEGGFVGVSHISGLDSEGYMAVSLTSTNGGGSSLSLKKPEWEKL